MSGRNGENDIILRELNAELWPDLENLFGRNAGCGGCWCQWWRIAGVEHWNDVKGEVARARLHQQVREGRAHGVLAYEGGKPVGWCSFEPRSTLPRVQRSRSFKGLEAEGAWFVGCFFVERSQRRRGIAELMLSKALEYMKRDGAEVVEACPRDTHGAAQPDAFVYTGTRAMFEHHGFAAAEGRRGATVLLKRIRKHGEDSVGDGCP